MGLRKRRRSADGGTGKRKMTAKPKILFFARGYQADFFPTLTSEHYDSVYVTLTENESARVRKAGGTVAACFERDFAGLVPASVPENYLYTSLMADRFLGRFDLDERRVILGKEIAFWTRLLDEYRPVAVFNELVAIEISEVLLIETRRRNIRYLASMHAPATNYFYWLPDPMTISGRKMPDIVPSEASRAIARTYMAELANKDYRPFYVQNLAGRRELKPLLIAVVKGLLWAWRGWRTRHGGSFRYELYTDEYSKRLLVYLKSFVHGYDRMEDIAADREVIFYPLHQEPEATLSYMSCYYANQVATIENILKCLTSNQVLVVKEHPVDKGSLLRRKFAEVRKQYSALYYLPAELSGRAVLGRAERVVTLTSTVGWEAASIGRKVYVLGEIFFDNVPGIDFVPNFDGLKPLFHAPVAEQPRVEKKAIEDLVATLVEMSYPGNPAAHEGLYVPENLALVVAAICDAAGIATADDDDQRDVNAATVVEAS